MTAEQEVTIRAAADQLVAAIVATVQAELAGPMSPPRPPRERLLSVGEAAAALAIGRSRLYGEIGAGRLRSVKVGRRRLVAASAIAAYIETLTRGGEPR